MSYEILAKEAVSLSLSEQIDLMALLANSIQSKNQQDIIIQDDKKDFRQTYPEGFFDLFGSLSDIDFREPEEIAIEHDVKRKEENRRLHKAF